ncbi:MAG: IS110 family transposase [Alteromonadales bacterium]|nr:IS110 family transposase [Alteromonadales bacterium]MCP4988696.1 IS110 family transposase [Colwellia sp.]
MKNTIVGVDLAKEKIQVCIFVNKKVHSNFELTHHDFLLWLITYKPVIIVFEACSTSNFWKQKASESGHDARLISAKLVSAIRQNQKTDKNDALAIIQASQLVDVTFINGKTKEQQQLQSIMRLRELAIKHKDALANQLEALLLEFNIRVSARKGGIRGVIEGVLEDAKNGFTNEWRAAINIALNQLLDQIKAVSDYDECLTKSINAHEPCKRLLKLEGVATINAVNLYIVLGCGKEIFNTGKDASACIGLTPKQHSSGGIVKLGSISKRVKNSRLRSQLITGAMAVVSQLVKRSAKTKKEVWLKGVIERKGKKCAAVALANKNVRTAYAMLSKGTEYKAELLTA